MAVMTRIAFWSGALLLCCVACGKKGDDAAGGASSSSAGGASSSSASGSSATTSTGASTSTGSGGSFSGACSTPPAPKGKTIHVSPMGGDSAAGTEAEPMSLKHAAEVAMGGDLVLLHGGTYDLQDKSQVKFKADATADAPLVIRNAPNETAVIQGFKAKSELDTEQRVITLLGANVWLVSDGDEFGPNDKPRHLVVAGGFMPTSVEYCKGCKIIGVESRESGHSCFAGINSDDHELCGVYAHNCGSRTHHHGTYPSGAWNNLKIVNSLFKDNAGCGIHPNFGHALEALGCGPKFENFKCASYGFGGPDECLPSGFCKCTANDHCPSKECDTATNRCVVHQDKTMLIAGNIVSGNPLCGVTIWDGHQDVVIENNLFIHNGAGGELKGRGALLIGTDYGLGIAVDVKFRNNTIIGNGAVDPSAGFAVEKSKGVKIFNNIVFGVGQESLVFKTDDAEGLSIDNNLYFHNKRMSSEPLFNGADFAAWQGAGFDKASAFGDPLFVMSPTDLHLKPGSPGIDKGNPDAPAKDITGKDRPQGAGFDLGAYEQ